MNNGIITQVESINVCDDLACNKDKCFDFNDMWLNQTYSESVRLKLNQHIKSYRTALKMIAEVRRTSATLKYT